MSDVPPQESTVRSRMSRTWLFPVLLFAFCLVSLSAATPWLLLVEVVPAVLAVAVLRTRVDVGPAGVTVSTLTGERSVAWSDVGGVRVGRRSELWLVTSGGDQLRLPTLRARHLPLISRVSGGRIPDPTAS
jgi:Bacterial PH domain